MVKLKTVVWSVCAALSVSSCALLESWEIKPDMAVKHSGPESQAQYRLGRYHQGRINYDEAIRAYQRALELDAGYVDAHNGLGVIFSAQGRYHEAIARFKTAVALAPQRAYLQNNLGYAYLLLGANDEAAKALEEARRLDPADARVTKNLQLAQNRLGAHRQLQQPAPAALSDVSSAPVLMTSTNRAGNAAAQLTNERDPNIKLIRVASNVFELQTAPVARAFVAPAPVVAHALAQPSPPARDQFAMPDKPFRLEVSNGNGINGMARRVAERLKSAGLPTARLTNQLPFEQRATEIQYREGHAAAAAKLGSTLQKKVLVVRSDQIRSDIHVRLVLGRDLPAEVALFDAAASDSKPKAAHVAIRGTK